MYFAGCCSTGFVRYVTHNSTEDTNFGEKGHRDKEVLPLHYTQCTYDPHDLWLLILTLKTWLKQCLSGFYTVNLLFFPHLSIQYFWKEIMMHISQRKGILGSFSSRCNTYISYLKFFCIGDLSLLSLLINLTIIFIMYILHEYLFYTLS